MATIDEKVKAEAKMWIDSLERKWRLQILSKRYRVNPTTGERKEMPLRIRRFAEGIPYACVDEALKYLLSLAPYKDIVYNGMLLEGEYLPTVTTWKRDDQDVVNGTSRTDGTYTLVQDLIDRRYLDQYSVASARSCTEEVVTDWTWDSPDIGDIPEDNPLQGVTYAIQSVSRNEDGTFNYALVKRTALTQHTPRVTTKVTADETIETESWDNLYGEPPDFEDDKGLPVAVPVAGYAPPHVAGSEGSEGSEGSVAPGTRTEVQVTKNDDCTYKVQAVYITDGVDRVDPAYLGDTSCLQDTEYEHHWRDLEVVDIQSTRQQGETKAIQNLRREDDGTYSYVVVTRTAKYRHTEELDVRVTPEGKVSVETWDNLYGSPSAGFATAVDGEPVAVPSASYDKDTHTRVEVQVSQNEDCTYKVQATTSVGVGSESDPDYAASESCLESVRQVHHWHESAVVDITDRQQGETKAIQNLRREDDGTYSYVVVTRTALTKDTGDILQTSSATEQVYVRTIHNAYWNDVTGKWQMRSAAGAALEDIDPSVPTASYNGSDGRIDVQVSRNEDCTYRVVVTKTKAVTQCHDHETTATIFERQEANRCIGQADPLEDVRKSEGDRDGVIETHESQQQPDGTYVTRTTVKTEQPVPRSSVTKSVGRRGTRITEVNVNQASEPDMSSIGVGGSVKFERTPGGLYNNTTVMWEKSQQTVGVFCTEDVFHHQHDVTKSGVDMPGSESDADLLKASGKDGLVVSKRTDMDEEGSVSQTTSKNQEILAESSEESWRVTPHGIVHTVKHRNVDKDARSDLFGSEPDGSVFDRTKIGSELVRSRTPGGWYDVTISDVDRRDALKVGVGCSQDVFLHTDTTVSSALALPEGSHVEEAGVKVLPAYVGSEGSEDDGKRGVYRSRDARVNADGTISVSDTVNVELPVKDAQVQDEDSEFVHVNIRVNRNQVGPFDFSSSSTRGSLDPTTHAITKKTYSKNKGGSYDVTVETREPHFRWWAHDTNTNWRWSRTVWFKNATEGQVQALYRQLIMEFNEKMVGSRSDDTPFAKAPLGGVFFGGDSVSE